MRVAYPHTIENAIMISQLYNKTLYICIFYTIIHFLLEFKYVFEFDHEFERMAGSACS